MPRGVIFLQSWGKKYLIGLKKMLYLKAEGRNIWLVYAAWNYFTLEPEEVKLGRIMINKQCLQLVCLFFCQRCGALTRINYVVIWKLTSQSSCFCRMSLLYHPNPKFRAPKEKWNMSGQNQEMKNGIKSLQSFVFPLSLKLLFFSFFNGS